MRSLKWFFNCEYQFDSFIAVHRIPNGRRAQNETLAPNGAHAPNKSKKSSTSKQYQETCTNDNNDVLKCEWRNELKCRYRGNVNDIATTAPAADDS